MQSDHIMAVLIVVTVVIFLSWLIWWKDRKDRGDFEIVSNEEEAKDEIKTYESNSDARNGFPTSRRTSIIRKVTYRSGRVEYKKTIIKR